MYAVTLWRNKQFVTLISFVNSNDEVEEIFNQLCMEYGADWLGENGYDLRVELAF